MASAKDIFYSIRLTDMFSGTIRQAGEHVQQFEGKVEHAKEKVSELGKEMLGAFVAFEAGEFLKESAHEFLETEANVKKLSLAIGARGGLASDLAELRKQADELQEKGIFDDDEALKIDQLGLQMGLSIEKVKQLTPIIEDVAARTGQASQSVLEAVLHGSQGMTRGLIQYGVHLKDTGSKTKNLAIIVEQLKKSYEGANEEIAKTTEGGKIANLTNEWKDFQKKVGEDLLKVFDNLLPALKEGVHYLQDFAEWIKKNGHEIKQYVVLIGEAWLAFKVLGGAAAIIQSIGAAFTTTAVETEAAAGAMSGAMATFNASLGPIILSLMAIKGIYDTLSSESSISVSKLTQAMTPEMKAKYDQFADTELETKRLELKGGKYAGMEKQFLASDYENQMKENQGTIDEGSKKYGGTYGKMKLSEMQDWLTQNRTDDDENQGERDYMRAVVENANISEKLGHIKGGVVAAPGKVGGSEGGFAGSDASNAGGKASKAEGSKVTTINISINDLVKQITLSVTNLKESTGAVREAVAEALISAVNDSQRVAGT